MFLLREASLDDLDGLTAVAAHLNSVNLPNDRAVLERLISHSVESFAGRVESQRREYLFVLIDKEKEQIIGTSMIHAQHGTRRAPHIFFDVLEDERYSETIDVHRSHRLLRIGYNYNGPTEIGGLVLLPSYRRHQVALGKWLSYVRFLYIGLHRPDFRDEVISELLPPLEPDGTSIMWEAIGRQFTGMSYQDADRLSQTNKEFVRALFPSEALYLALFPKAVQDVIGQVGPQTKGVEAMLRRIGFRYAERIDPFDGGPHFIARTEDVTLVRQTRRARVKGSTGGADEGRPFGLVCVERPDAPHFFATGSRFRVEDEVIYLPPEVRRLLGVSPGDSVGYVPS
jgi:arginine N-succinyltransferase